VLTLFSVLNMSRLDIYWPELSTEDSKEDSFDVVMTPNLADKICKGWQYRDHQTDWVLTE
jgi:hypothetical protein